jgi:Ca-activated chloride channel family protein
VSFSSPGWLLALAVIPAALAVSWLVRRRATRYAIRFPAVATLREAASVPGSRWLSRLPAALALLAVASLALALARPHVRHAVPVNEASLMLVTDVSGSMAADDVSPSRLAAAERAANNFIDKLPSKARVGAITFSGSAQAVQGPVTNHDAAREIIDNASPNGATATGDAIDLALQLLHGASTKHPPSAIVLLSDGAANTGADPVGAAHQAGRDRIPIYTVALGTPNGTLPNPDPFSPPLSVPPDPQLMNQIARASGGRAFNAQSADELSSIYGHLGSQLSSVTRSSEVTVAFTLAALVLLACAAALSVRRAARLP